VITEEIAMKYFGTTDVLEKTIKKGNSTNHTITGVIANVPSNSHLSLISFCPCVSSRVKTAT